MGYHVAVVGASGAVGREMIRVLEARNFPVERLTLLAGRRSAGSRLAFHGEPHRVQEATPERFQGVQLALFSAGSGPSRALAPEAVARGAVVIDNSSAFRLEPEVPLVVPEVNPQAAAAHRGIVANPNCSTIQFVVTVYPLHRAAGLRRVRLATYQAASGAGAAAMEELLVGTRRALAGEAVPAEQFPHPLAFNLIPHIDVFEPNGYTREEMKLVRESRKIMDLPELAISATCVRVPILRAHSEAIFLETERKLGVEQARRLLREAPGVEVVDEPEQKRYPMPQDASGRAPVLVGRIREDLAQENGLALFCVADQLLKGAALNAVQIAELLFET